jgi:hypothetical protein
MYRFLRLGTALAPIGDAVKRGGLRANDAATGDLVERIHVNTISAGEKKEDGPAPLPGSSSW